MSNTRQAIIVAVVAIVVALIVVGVWVEQDNAESNACDYGNDLAARHGMPVDDC